MNIIVTINISIDKKLKFGRDPFNYHIVSTFDKTFFFVSWVNLQFGTLKFEAIEVTHSCLKTKNMTDCFEAWTKS